MTEKIMKKVLEEIEVAMVHAMQDPNGKRTDSDGEELSDSDTDDEGVRIFRNMPEPVCLFYKLGYFF